MKPDKVRDFILFHTSFYDTSVIHERDLLELVNKKFDLKYQLNRFQDIYIDNMKNHFRKYKGNDGYWIYERIDINPDPEWTLSMCLFSEELYRDQKEYEKNEDFLTCLDYARRHNDIEFEEYIKNEKLLELMPEVIKSMLR